MRVRETLDPTRSVGPLLFCRCWDEGRLHLAVLELEDDGPAPMLDLH